MQPVNYLTRSGYTKKRYKFMGKHLNRMHLKEAQKGGKNAILAK